jgi:hypothetical protein
MARNITTEFIARLVVDGYIASGLQPPSAWWGALGLVGVAIGGYKWYDKLSTFRSLVQAGGAWDFKSNWLKGDKDSNVEVAGKVYRYDMPGNFHYGFVGAAAEIPDGILYSQAGKAQVGAGTSKPEYWCTYGDDPEDNEFIRLGIKLYNDVELQVKEADLKQVLSHFNMKVCGSEPAGHDASDDF